MRGRILTLAALALCTGASATTAVAAAKVDICHYDGMGRVFVINVAVRAAAAHAANHGDHSVGTYYADLDGDGFGAAASGVQACAAPAGFVDNALDCDDTNAGVSPGAAAVCDGVADNDCSGVADPNETDDDGDGVTECGGDCNDADANNAPGNTETCGNGADDNCDGQADEGCVADVCAPYSGTGCYWRETSSGNACWVPAPWVPPGIDWCRGFDSCAPGGGGWSGGACYKWASCSGCPATPWP